MAGAGYKVFADGDVLTAAQVQTYLQDQAVMKFADSSARTTDLGGSVSEGMVSYLADTDAVEVYDGSAWTAIGAAGIGSNVVTGTYGTAVTVSTTAYADTNLSATITPTSATSKVLILVSQPVYVRRDTSANFAFLQILRDATVIQSSISSAGVLATPVSTDLRASGVLTFVYLDSPSTTSAVTYKTQGRPRFATNNNVAYFNADLEGVNADSFITLIEVQA